MSNITTTEYSYLARVLLAPLVLAWALGLPFAAALMSAIATAGLMAWRIASAGTWLLIAPVVIDSGNEDQ